MTLVSVFDPTSLPRFLASSLPPNSGNKAGSGPGPERTVRKIDPAWMRETFELNLFGHVQMTSELFNSGSVTFPRNRDL